MGQDSKIEWTDHTFNPWWGCVKVSPACEHCYAETFSKRVGQKVWGTKAPRRFFGDKHWNEPLKWNAAAAAAGVRARVFCASMADVFEDREDLTPHLARLLKLIHETPNLDWLLLTKRPENWSERIGRIVAPKNDMDLLMWIYNWGMGTPPQNVWIGTTVENQEYADRRIPELLKIPARVRFLSVEPMLGPVDLSWWLEPWEYCGNCGGSFSFQLGRPDLCPGCLRPNCMATGFGLMRQDEFVQAQGYVDVPDNSGISWVICGGESGPGARPLHPDWARSLRDQCQVAGVPFFFKQWGEWASNTSMGTVLYCKVGKKLTGRLLEGREWNEMPNVEVTV
jgi:protein gp37